MQPLIVLAIVAVGAGAMSMGFLTNTIDLSMVQQFGVGEATIESPVDTAYIDFIIDRTTYTKDGKTVMRNVIDQCRVQLNKAIPEGSHIVCKLTDALSNVVAEGALWIMTTLPAGTPTNVPITLFASGTPMDSDVTNIHDVILVVIGPEQTGQ